MAFLGLQIPHQTARLLSQVDYGGVGEATGTDTYHITICYLGSDIPIEVIGKALPVIFDVTSKTKPFTVGTNRVTTFPGGPDGVPIICRVTSDALHDLRDALWAALDDAGIEYNKKFPEFKPHVTLAYAPEEEVSQLLAGDDDELESEFPLVEWGAHELVLWGGDSGDGRLVVNFPFSMEQTKAAVERAFVRLAASSSV